MSATVQIDESNTVGETQTTNISNTNMGSVDAANLDPVANPVVPGNNTYEKYQRFHVTALGGSSAIQNLRVWRTGALGGAAVHKTNARTSAYAGAATYATPVATTSAYTQTMPTADPGTANLGIAGSLAGTIVAPGYSDYLVHQIQTNAADTAGSTSTMNYEYDEIA